MAEMTEYGEGMPSWTDLVTPDLAASEAFYGGLFGWVFVRGETPGTDYVLATKGGRNVAGLMPINEQMAAGGMPPSWTCYVHTDDIDATAGKVADAGGTVLQAPMTVAESGRMSIVADPAGAVLGLWQPDQHRGAELMGEHGAMVWMELTTPSPAAITDFYAQVLGWTVEVMGEDMGNYHVFSVPGGAENGVAGAMAPQAEGMPSYWGVYFAVDDCDAIAASAQELGATVLAGPMDIPTVGRFAALLDPQGAAFSVLHPMP